MCLYPKLIDNPKYRANKKNGGLIPTVFDERVKTVPIGCGKCKICMKRKANEWKVRLNEELRVNNNAKFYTLTFTDESLVELGKEVDKNGSLEGYEHDNECARIGVRRFLERWRKSEKKSVRHWLVTELGQKNTERIHIHGLLWTDKTKTFVEKKWKYGNAILGDGKGKHYVNEETIGYIVKYLSKTDEKHKEYKPRMFVSSGIGKSYLKRRDHENNIYIKGNTDERYTTRSGIKVALPIYYRNKLYTEEQREKLWIEKLDKNIMWINGNKIDLTLENSEEIVTNVLKEERALNRRFGYGDNKINWDRRIYENNLRNLKKLKRIRGRES